MNFSICAEVRGDIMKILGWLSL